jgi:RimJ/RimL family protein N-acetyltransferase
VASRFLEPVTLAGTHATLEPLAPSHLESVAAAAADGELWKLWYTSVPAPESAGRWLDTALDMRERLGAMPFVVRDNASGDVVGSTRYFNVDAANRRLEIGHTWYARRAQRTAINTECKLLLLTHAFESLHCIAVEFRTHWFNQASRAAIARLGAKQDGVLRSHQLMPDGSRRDTVVFSIIEGEWPAVKAHLRFLLLRRRVQRLVRDRRRRRGRARRRPRLRVFLAVPRRARDRVRHRLVVDREARGREPVGLKRRCWPDSSCISSRSGCRYRRGSS